jgi:hypothetical protein
MMHVMTLLACEEEGVLETNVANTFGRDAFLHVIAEKPHCFQ